MSYILDALKKAEKERKQGTLPDMLTVQDIVAEKPKKRFTGVYFLVVALVLNAGILVWWLGSSHTGKTTVSHTSKAENTTIAANEGVQLGHDIPESPVAEQAGSPETRPAEIVIPAAERSASAKPDIKSDRPKEILKGPDTRSKSVTDHPAPASDTARTAGQPPENPKQSEGTGRLASGLANEFNEMPEENKIYKLAELPSSIRQGLPSFSVTALLYSSSPASRMVRVNEKMMHEGQDLAAGVKLEEITRDGLVLSYRNFRFYIGAK